MITLFKKLFGKKVTTIAKKLPYIEILSDRISIQYPFEPAKVVLMKDSNVEYIDLEEKHKDFFEIRKIQNTKEEPSANIVDVLPSKSDLFFKQAPVITMTMGDDELSEDFLEQTEALEKYNNIPVYNKEQTTAELEICLEEEELRFHKHTERYS